MKWKHNGIMYHRGCCDVLIARYDRSGPWYANDCRMTQQSMRASFKRLGEYLDARSVEVKLLYDEEDLMPVEPTICAFLRFSDGTYRFRENVKTMD